MMVGWENGFSAADLGQGARVPNAEKGRRKIKEEGLYTSRIDMV
jgi:hypothetical protein